MAKNSFVENINSIANAVKVADGAIVDETLDARDQAVAAAASADSSESGATLSELEAQKWAENGFNIPVNGAGEFSAYHWAVVAAQVHGDPLINDTIIDLNYTWSSFKISSMAAGKAEVDHNHNGVYEPAVDKKSAFNKNFAGTGGLQLDIDGEKQVAYSDHDHNSDYEPAIPVKGSAFNKDFGMGNSEVARGDHNHDASYMKTATYIDANSKIAPQYLPFNTDGIFKSTEVAKADHIHLAASIVYDNTGNLTVTSGTTQGAIQQLDAIVGTLSYSEKSKLNAAMSDPHYIVPVVSQNVLYRVNAGMAITVGSKNALYSNGITINYPSNPDNFVEGNYSAILAVNILPNQKYELTIGVNGEPSDTTIEIGSDDKATTGTIPVTLSGFISGLSNGDVIEVYIANLTGVEDIQINDMFVSFAGEPEGALIVNTFSIQHDELLGRDAVSQHPFESIFNSANAENLVEALDRKADKVSGGVEDNIVTLDAAGNIKDSGVSPSIVLSKADKITLPTESAIVVQDSNGNIADSGTLVGDLAPKAGNSLQLFNVAAGASGFNAVNYDQMFAFSASFAPIADFNNHLDTVLNPNPHAITPALISAAEAIHNHDITTLTNYTSVMDAKIDTVPTAVPGNVPAFDATGNLVDSGGIGGDVEEAPINGTPYARQDAGWVPAVSDIPNATATVVGGITAYFDVATGELWLRNDGADATPVP